MLPAAIAIAAIAWLPGCSDDGGAELPAPDRADLTRTDFTADPAPGCLASGCHQQLTQRRWVHAPAAVGACEGCHLPSGVEPADHRFTPAVAPRDMCLHCHSPAAADEFIHEPYGSASCVGCHDPHGGARKDLLLTERVEELCLSCHPGEAVAVPHQPREQGDCLSCHRAHSSRHEHLLLRQPTELCSACHREYRGFLAENILNQDFVSEVHPALLSEGCLACHQAHGSQRPAMMRAELHVNCERCHSDLTEGLEQAEVVHGAFSRDDSCVLCHTPHASVFDGLLAAPPAELCFQCHAEEVEMASGRVLNNIQQQLAEAEVVHQPVAEGDCTVCHIAHFSRRRSLLRLEYPEKIYGKFSGGSYELCFQCHDRQLVSEEGSRFTGFRDGQLNLHFVHVNREKGRACDICHDPHAAPGYRLMRETYPFGPSRWPLPLGFVATPTGGSCSSACHEQRSYER